MALLGQPTEHLTNSQIKRFSEEWNGEAIARFFKKCYRAIGKIDKYQFFFRVNQPAHLGSVAETVEDVADYFGLALVWGKDFNSPVRGDGEGVSDFPLFVAGNSFPGKDTNIGNSRSTAKGAAQF